MELTTIRNLCAACVLKAGNILASTDFSKIAETAIKGAKATCQLASSSVVRSIVLCKDHPVATVAVATTFVASAAILHKLPSCVTEPLKSISNFISEIPSRFTNKTSV